MILLTYLSSTISQKQNSNATDDTQQLLLNDILMTIFSVLEKYYVGELIDNEMPIYNSEE